MKKETLKDLEKYSVWIKVNDILNKPSFIISLIYIIIYLLIIFLVLLRPEMMKPYLIYFYIGFPFFIIALWLAFSGLLWRSVK